jgi:hypothetical protein
VGGLLLFCRSAVVRKNKVAGKRWDDGAKKSKKEQKKSKKEQKKKENDLSLPNNPSLTEARTYI